MNLTIKRKLGLLWEEQSQLPIPTMKLSVVNFAALILYGEAEMEIRHIGNAKSAMIFSVATAAR